VSVLAEVAGVLERLGSAHAVIGATALAVLGTSRSTLDIDVLTTDLSVLQRATWSEVAAHGLDIDIRVGDIGDPLVDVVRVSRGDERPVDIIVGEAPWQRRILGEAQRYTIGEVEVPVVGAVGLVLLKLYAGGPQDLWDIEQLLSSVPNTADLARQVGERLSALPERCRAAWDKVSIAE
jgi:hypothetical protein